MIKYVYLLYACSEGEECVIGVYRTKEKAEEQRKRCEELYGDNTYYCVEERLVV